MKRVRGAALQAEVFDLRNKVWWWCGAGQHQDGHAQDAAVQEHVARRERYGMLAAQAQSGGEGAVLHQGMIGGWGACVKHQRSLRVGWLRGA